MRPEQTEFAEFIADTNALVVDSTNYSALELLLELKSHLMCYTDYVERKVAFNELPMLWVEDWEVELEKMENE